MAFVIGVWWTINGVGAFLIDANFATDHVHGGGKLFGSVAITVNGWHALFHLLPGLLGVALASRPRPALAYTLVAGASYIVVASWGLLAGTNALGVIAVDTSGDLVHLVEGVFLLAAGLLTISFARGGFAGRDQLWT
jgi:Domain of unknown function (DUF4383)